MGYVTGDDRRQPCLLPPVIDDYVDPNAPVRVIDAFVDGLDFSALGFERAAPASTGRPGYDPRDLLKLYIYGYLNEVRSSRRLERECRRNVEVMWLVGRLAPDHKTIADFRRDNGAAIVGACRAFVLFCRDQELFTAVLVSIDGSKVRAAASTLRVLDQSRIAEEAQKIDAEIAGYLAELDQADTVDHGEECDATTQVLAALRERRAELNRLAAHLDKDDRRLVVEGELDARPMGYRTGGKPPSHNIRIAVDADTGFVVHHDVTDEVNNLRMLHPMAAATRNLLGRDTLKVVADTGYSNGNAAAACEADEIVVCVPAIRSVNNRGDGDRFDRSRFRYDPDHDQYTCPAGRTMHRKGPVNRSSFYYVSRDCSGCELKPRCTQAEVRWVSRHQHEDALERMTKRVTEEPTLMRRRRCSAEHPFGTMKRMMAGRFITRGFRGTRTEMALTVLAFNMIRCISLRAQRS
jgi:transposase